MRLRGDSHPPAGRPRGSPLLWTGLESRFIRGFVGATLVVARRDRSMLLSFCIPTVIRQQSLPRPGLALAPRREAGSAALRGRLAPTARSSGKRNSRTLSLWQHCDLVWKHFPFMTLLITFSLRALIILAGESSAYHLTRCEVRRRSITHEHRRDCSSGVARIGFLVARQHETEKITSP